MDNHVIFNYRYLRGERYCVDCVTGGNRITQHRLLDEEEFLELMSSDEFLCMQCKFKLFEYYTSPFCPQCLSETNGYI